MDGLNRFWGWGGEDDDIRRRINKAGLQLTRYSPVVARYNWIWGIVHSGFKKWCFGQFYCLSQFSLVTGFYDGTREHILHILQVLYPLGVIQKLCWPIFVLFWPLTYLLWSIMVVWLTIYLKPHLVHWVLEWPLMGLSDM